MMVTLTQVVSSATVTYPFTRNCVPNVLKGMDSPALGVNNASRRQRLRPLAISQKTDTALHDKKHLVFILVPVRRRAAAGRGGTQGDDHQAIGLRATELDLRGVAVGVKCLAAVRRDDKSLRRRGSSGDNRLRERETETSSSSRTEYRTPRRGSHSLFLN